MSGELQSLLQQARGLIQAGENRAAVKVLIKLLRHYPDCADVHYLVSYVTEMPEEQLAALRRTIALNPEHMAAHRRLAKLEDMQRETQECAVKNAAAADNPLRQLKALQAQLDAGNITQAEFDAQKLAILARM